MIILLLFLLFTAVAAVRKNGLSMIILLLFLLFTANVSAQTIEPTWEQINQRGYPQWFGDAKLGIFVHWGLYSVPAYASPEGYGEWFYRGLMTGDSGRVAAMQRHGGQPGQSPLQQYALLRDQWKGELWDPDEWAEIFRQSGARYVLLVTKHHDGYCLWDYANTALKDWNSVVSGPRRDIVKELTAAVRRQGLRMGFYFSLAEWTNPLHTWTVSPNDSVGRYVELYMIPQFKDLVGRYHPSVIFTDGEWDNNAEQWHARELISWYYNTVGSEGIVNNRWGHGNQHGYKTPEYSGGIMDTVSPWAECRGLGRSFGINHNEPLSNYLSSEELIQHFVKLVAAGGGLTLNVGPEADGRIPLLQQERLLSLGRWLETNGEAIYGSRPCAYPYEYNDTLTFERIDSLIDFDWVRNAPIKGMTYDHFNVHWEGRVEPLYTERYTFQVEVDDDVVVTLDGDTLIAHFKDVADAPASNAQAARNYASTSAAVTLQRGKSYRIEVSYREKDLEARMRLRWSSKSQRPQPVPAVGGWSGSYRCLAPSLCYTRQGDTLYAIALQAPGETLALHHLPIPPKGMKVKLLGCERPVEWHYSEGVLYLHTGGLSYADLAHCQGAWTFRIPLKQVADDHLR